MNNSTQVDSPFCLFCDDDQASRMMCEREMVSSIKHRMRGGASLRGPYVTSSSSCSTTSMAMEEEGFGVASALANG